MMRRRREMIRVERDANNTLVKINRGKVLKEGTMWEETGWGGRG